MKDLFQTTEKNPTFSKIGNGIFGNVIRTGWKPSKLGEAKRAIVLQALEYSNVDKAYKRWNKIYAFLLNGTEKVIA